MIKLKSGFRKMPYLSGQKVAREIMGGPSGQARMPLSPATKAEQMRLRKVTDKLGLI
jgi:hypothetical protein